MGERITMKDLARMAGTSLSTVSRSLNDNPVISAETREQIKELAHRYGFDFNMSAKSLATRRNSTIGLIFPESLDNPDNFAFAGMLLRNVRSVLEEAALDTLISFNRNYYSGESNIRRLLRQGKVDGLLLIQPHFEPGDFEAVMAAGLPYVLLHFLPEGVDYAATNYVYVDHVLGGRLAAEHLIDSGCRRILCLTERERQFKERTEGYRRAHRERKLPVHEHLIFSADATFEAGYRTIFENRASIEAADGIFAQADITALGVLAALRELGVRVPEDIPLVGYDDIRMAGLNDPPLTTVHQPQEQLVRSACRRLVELLGGAAPEPALHHLLEPWLVCRSTAPALNGKKDGGATASFDSDKT
ncbi:MAG: substrate-binding domain-containing protein [Spirochaetes bacterium]|jgi:LacI family transcriptional regulator|nr:substrate-binding domain-containing protein [Spirochaetota bacterium]